MMNKKIVPFLLCLLIAVNGFAQLDINNIGRSVKSAKPGDTIIVANGTYKDAALILEGIGSKEKPIVVKAATPGGVKLTGSSFVKLAGEFLEFNGFHFTDGFTKSSPVIEFRRNNDNLANNCRVTNCVIDNYSKPERFDTDSWIVFWGKNNRFDHNTIGDKLNGGTTLIVNLNDERSQQNFHSIDSNFFAGRQRLGSNGGETIRIGVSRYSLTASNTSIAYNFFEKVNGEVEIVSIKAGDNHVHHNTFLECEGGLVLRHGSSNVLESNLFIGNNKPHTGGIRVINPGHRVINNLLVGLAGDRFRSALGVLNGVPNSLINRYYQVTDADIVNNSFINCNSIVFGAGKDAERTLGPRNVKFRNNFIATRQNVLFEDANRDGGILFSNNSYTGTITNEEKGFTKVRANARNWKELLIDVPTNNTGADLSKLTRMDAQTTGASWYVAPAPKPVTGNVTRVKASQSKQLPELVSKAGNGDVFILEYANVPYELDKEITVSKTITIKAEDSTKKVEFVNVAEKSLPAFIVIENGGNLTASGIKFSGTYKSFGDVHAGISTTAKNPMNQHYNLYVDNCEFYNYNESSQSGIKATKNTIADNVSVRHCLFRNISGTGIDFSAEKDDKGIYNVERIEVINTVFTNLLGAAIVVYRGGNDESTTGPSVLVDHCVFNEVNNMEQGVVVKLLGAQEATITNSIFSKSGQGGRTIWFEENSWDKLKVDNINFHQSGRVQSFYGKAVGKNVTRLDPAFVNSANFNFKLKSNSPLLTKSSRGKALGIL
jgi:poly(beta-D-mannuronate) lyase